MWLIAKRLETDASSGRRSSMAQMRLTPAQFSVLTEAMDWRRTIAPPLPAQPMLVLRQCSDLQLILVGEFEELVRLRHVACHSRPAPPIWTRCAPLRWPVRPSWPLSPRFSFARWRSRSSSSRSPGCDACAPAVHRNGSAARSNSWSFNSRNWRPARRRTSLRPRRKIARMRQRAKPKRKPLPDHLPRQEIVHQPEADGACTCPDCAGMAKLGEDVTEVLDYVPGHFLVIRHVRPKYACKSCDAITQAPAAAMPTPRGRATPATLAHVLVSKYCDHLPLYRQSEIYARDVDLDFGRRCATGLAKRSGCCSRSSMGSDDTCSWLRRSMATTPRCRCSRQVSVGPRRDGSGVYVRDDRPFAARTRGRLRTTSVPIAAASIRRSACPTSPASCRLIVMPGSRHSTIGASPMKATVPTLGLPRWHAGRIVGASSSMCGMPRNRRSPSKRSTALQPSTWSRPRPALPRLLSAWCTRAETARLLASFFDWAGKVVTKLSAKSELAEAGRYTIKRREPLSRFLTDARLEIDNNVAENALRGIALGRKNYLFAGSDSGGGAGGCHVHHPADREAQ